MFQKEVAERSVLLPDQKPMDIERPYQAYYTAEYLFTYLSHVFTPPPKVKSGVIRLKRK